MTAAPVPARMVLSSGHGRDIADSVALDYDGRFLRRRVLETQTGRRILVDLAQTRSLDEGDALVLDTGDVVAVVAAPEPLTEVRGQGLARLAWHIGNRHTPCEILEDALRIRRDPVLADMLVRLGAELDDLTAPFRPEGGAYGHGRTHGHDHGTAEGGRHEHRDVRGGGHDHAHDHGHLHDHPQSHDHGPHDRPHSHD